MLSLKMVIFYVLVLYNFISYIFFWVNYTKSKKDPSVYDVTDKLMFLGKSQVFAKANYDHPRTEIDLRQLESDATSTRVLYL